MTSDELIKQGQNNITLAQSNMGALMEIKKRFEKEKPLQGQRIGMALHITKETANLVETLEAGGAEVAVAGCNPLSTQDDVAEAMRAKGSKAYGLKGQSSDEYYKCLNQVLDIKPTITIDDGCDLVTEVHLKRQDLMVDIIGGCEETTTGIIRVEAMEKEGVLKYPVIAVNDNKTKHLMDNYYGTGQSTWDGIIRATNTLVAGKTVIVAGYGSCGKGCAMRAKGMGADVIVTEVDTFPALQARMDGFRVMQMKDAAPQGDIFITVTGNKHVIRPEHAETMKEGAILANSGHFDIEIDVKGIREKAKETKQVRPFMERFSLQSGKDIYILAEGRLINLSAAEGHPADVMSMSFCGQALACEYLVKNQGKLENKLIQLPEEIDDNIAELQLDTMGIQIDKLTEEQIKYLNSWQEGTA